MRLDPRLPKALSGTESELCDRRGVHAEQWGDLRGLHPLDLGVPEHFLPPRRQAAERADGDAPVEGCGGGLLAAGGILDGLEFVRRGFPAGSTPSGSGVADAGEQIRPEGAGRAAAAQDRLVDAREGLLDQIVGFQARGHRVGDGEPRAVVASPQFSERGAITRAAAQDEVVVRRVAQRVRRTASVVDRRHVNSVCAVGLRGANREGWNRRPAMAAPQVHCPRTTRFPPCLYPDPWRAHRKAVSGVPKSFSGSRVIERPRPRLIIGEGLSPSIGNE